METLEVTSLAEIREVSAEIVAQNRENARRALEKASATVGGGAWVSPTSGDALVAPLAGSRRAADKAKRRSSKTRDASGKDFSRTRATERSANRLRAEPPREGAGLAGGCRAATRGGARAPELDAVEERSAGLRPISPAAARDRMEKVLRARPRAAPEPVAGEPLAAALAKHKSVAPVLERAQRLRREAEEKARARAARRGGRQGGGGGQDGARAARGGARRRRGRGASRRSARGKRRRPGRPRGSRRRAAQPRRRRAPRRRLRRRRRRTPRLPGDAGGARGGGAQSAAAAKKKAKAAESRVARERFDLERRARVRERARARARRRASRARRRQGARRRGARAGGGEDPARTGTRGETPGG